MFSIFNELLVFSITVPPPGFSSDKVLGMNSILGFIKGSKNSRFTSLLN